MGTKHTPGEWRVIQRPHDWRERDFSPGKYVCIKCGLQIAGARAMMTNADTCSPEWVPIDWLPQKESDALRAAIRKAEGGEP